MCSLNRVVVKSARCQPYNPTWLLQYEPGQCYGQCDGFFLVFSLLSVTLACTSMSLVLLYVYHTSVFLPGGHVHISNGQSCLLPRSSDLHIGLHEP